MKSSNPVFPCKETRERFLASLRTRGDVEEQETWDWLRTPPRDTIVRVNLNVMSREEAIVKLREHLGTCGRTVEVEEHPTLGEVLIIPGRSTKDSTVDGVPQGKYVVVGSMCGLAVLRGADVFCPGIVGAPVDLQPGDRVSVLADVRDACLRGAKYFDGETCFVGCGISQVSRAHLYKSDNAVKGVGIHMEDSVYSCPSMDESVLPAALMLQNLPSILVVDLLDPKPGEIILDMCAAPGGKTCHIAARLQGKGRVVAFDKSGPKVATIQRNAARQYLADMVSAHVMDGTKSILDLKETVSPPNLDPSQTSSVPPFPSGTFDRVLVDAPCSALGQRPQFYNNMKVKELESFPKIQRKLLRSGVKHLKPGGILVYSTCTNNVEENERMADWALLEMDCLEKVEIDPTSGQHYQVFGHPRANHDTISFFVAKFRRKF